MKPATFVQPFHVRQIGEAAHRLLTPSLRGKVLAAFESAAYLYSTQEELLWLATERAPLHRRCLQISERLPRLAVGAPFMVQDQHLVIGPQSSLDVSQASIWKPSRLSCGDAVAITTLPERTCAAFSALCDWLPPVGFGSLIPEIMLIAKNHSALRSPQKPAAVPARVWPAIQGIAVACLAHDVLQIRQQASALVGLGEGLTPAGDDFVSGLLFCMTTLHSLYPDTGCLEFPGQSDFIESLKPYTNIISLTILKDHAAGHAVETLHQFVNTLLTGQPLERIHPLASALTQIGHSTGWDLLAGVLTGMLLTFHAISDGERNSYGHQTTDRVGQ